MHASLATTASSGLAALLPSSMYHGHSTEAHHIDLHAAVATSPEMPNMLLSCVKVGSCSFFLQRSRREGPEGAPPALVCSGNKLL